MRILSWLKATMLAAAILAANAAMAAPAPANPGDERVQESNLPSVTIDRSTMEFRSPDGSPVKFEIFSITGQLIKSVTVKSAPVKIELPKGFYIVKCESWTKRVMLK